MQRNTENRSSHKLELSQLVKALVD